VRSNADGTSLTAELGSVPVGKSQTEVLGLNNYGSSDLTVLDLTRAVGGTEFTVTLDGGHLVVAGGKALPLTVTFAPLFSGTMSEQFLMTTDSDEHPKVIVTVSGLGN
jgi:Abnormal spindle-like microcephaly-assoc'd, ASPM-SPD-2-Hydin